VTPIQKWPSRRAGWQLLPIRDWAASAPLNCPLAKVLLTVCLLRLTSILWAWASALASKQ